MSRSILTLTGGGGRVILSSCVRFRRLLIRLILMASAVNFGVICKELHYHHAPIVPPHGYRELADYYESSSSSSPALTNQLYQLTRTTTTSTIYPRENGRGYLGLDLYTWCLLILKILKLACICSLLLCLLLILCPLIPLIIAATTFSLFIGLSLIPLIAFFGIVRPPATTTPAPGDDDDFQVITNRSV